MCTGHEASGGARTGGWVGAGGRLSRNTRHSTLCMPHLQELGLAGPRVTTQQDVHVRPAVRL